MAERAHPDDEGFRDRWFGLKKNPYRENLFRRYQHCQAYIDDKVVLDIPCGMGWGTSMLQGAKSLHGVDIDPGAVSEARERYPGISFAVGDMVSFNSLFQPGYFDVIICLEGFEHVTYVEGQAFLGNVRSVLKPGGVLVLSTPLLIEGRYHSGNKYHLCEYKESELLQTLEAHGFSVLKKDYLPTAHGASVALFTLSLP